MIPDQIPTEFYDRLLFAMNHMGEMVIQLEMHFDHHLDQDRLERALHLAMDAEPVLGCRFDRGTEFGVWRRLSRGDKPRLVRLPNPAAFDAFRLEMTDAEAEPLLSLGLLAEDDGDRLLLKVAHEVADAAAVKQVAQLLSKIYQRLTDQPDYQPAPNLAGERCMEQLVRHLPWAARPRILVNFIKEAGTQMFGRPCQTLDLTGGMGGKVDFLHESIAGDRAAAIVEFAHLHQATLNDVFVTAYVRGLARVSGWSGEKSLRVTMTIDLRRYIPGGRCGGLCNLSSLEPISLGRRLEDDFAETLSRVALLTSDRKAHWLGLNIFGGMMGLMRNMPLAKLQKFFNSNFDRLQRRGIPPGLTNMGSISGLDFGGEAVHAFLVVPPLFSPLVTFGLSGYGRNFDLTVGVYPESRDSVAAVMAAMLDELTMFVCCSARLAPPTGN